MASGVSVIRRIDARSILTTHDSLTAGTGNACRLPALYLQFGLLVDDGREEEQKEDKEEE